VEERKKNAYAELEALGDVTKLEKLRQSNEDELNETIASFCTESKVTDEYI